MKKRVVVDFDPGTDDAAALLLLLTHEGIRYEVVGVTCTHGNTTIDNVCKNALTILESIKRSDIPVFRGAERPLITLEDPKWKNVNYFHGRDGFGDKGFPPPTTKIQTENAIHALNRLAKGGISLICLGPLTNIALALRTHSEFRENVREVYIMGGNVTGVGNATPSAEFNFFSDPEAAHIVLSSFICPVTILPWESCLVEIMTLEERRNVDCTEPHMQLLNKIELHLYKGKTHWTPCDAFLTAIFIRQEMIKKHRNLHLQVELGGHYSRGQGVVNPHMFPNVRIVDEMNGDVFKELISKMASFTPPQSR